jgi:hypothetical protein
MNTTFAQSGTDMGIGAHNSGLSHVGTLPVEIVQAATLIAAALNSGRVKIKPDNTVTVDGVPPRKAPLPGGGDLTSAAGNQPNIFQFNGKIWTLRFDGKLVTERDKVGMHYIHTQLQKPFIGVKSSELVAAINCHQFNCVKPEQVLVQDYDENSPKNSKLSPADSIPVDAKVDMTALQQIRKQVKVLKGELESYLANGEELAAKEAEDEIKKINKYLKESCIKVRSGIFTSAGDKNRKSVSVAIARAIRSIEKVHPALAKHLKNSIKTGFSCCYTPEKETEWVL